MWVQLLLIAPIVVCANAYKVLVAFPMPSGSHSILGDGVVNALLKANHEVTYITPFPKGKSLKNIREIDVSGNADIFPSHVQNITSIMTKETNMQNLTFFVNSMAELNSKTILNPNVQKILLDPKETFDVIVVEWLFFEFMAGLSAVYKCPFIWLSPTEPNGRILQLVDDLPNPAYTPDIISSNIPPFTFVQRVQELAFQIGGLALEYFTADPIQVKHYEEILAPIIRQRGHEVPAFHEVKYNASLVLSNSHVSIGKAIRLPPNVIPVGGYHINRENKPLPENLQKLLDNAKNGLIYFSMGSNLKSKYMTDELKRSLLNMFGELKYTVLWKFEEDLPNKPNNVHIVQWAPQQSILAHPNCVLFITHGGLLSTTETIHFGKPIVAIPVFADQFNNANLAERKGFGKKVDLSFTMAGDIKKAVEEVLNEPKYLEKVKELSMIYHSRPVTPDKELVHWVELVVKTRGARHLQSPAFGLSWYQKLYLDFIALVILASILIVLLIKRIISYCKIDKKSHKGDKKKKQ